MGHDFDAKLYVPVNSGSLFSNVSANSACPCCRIASCVVVWIYYSSLILFFGVELTQVTVALLRNRIEPAANADLVLNSVSKA